MTASRKVNTDTCLIIAAGMGTRVSHLIDSKPLLAVHGEALIDRVILAARTAGIEHFVVVSGYNGDKLRKHLDDFALREQLHIRHVPNEEYRRPNGISVYKAADILRKPFFLVMADHLIDPSIMSDMNKATLPKDGLLLAVDYALNNPNVDLDDVTKVAVDNGAIQAIDKKLAPYNGYDTGIFLSSPALFGALQESIDGGDESLSGGVRKLAQRGRAHAFDIRGRLWVDVDDEAAYRKATQAFA